jgi:hypothetical protein
MRQVMPHRNNIAMRRTKSKIFFASRSAETIRYAGIDRKSRRNFVEKF